MKNGDKLINETELKSFIVNNQDKGFDELSYILNIPKDTVKEYWNSLNLWFKLIPRTMIKFSTITRKTTYWKYFTKSKTHYILDEDYVVFLSKFHPIIIPKWFETDLGSIPAALHWLIDKDRPQFLIAFIVHDLLYRTKIINHRIHCDIMLSYFSFLMGAKWYRRYIVFWGLFIWGWIAWRQEIETDLINDIAEATFKYMEEKWNNIRILHSQLAYN
jgi:hypothetical protein